jgi:hypothetical protein
MAAMRVRWVTVRFDGITGKLHLIAALSPRSKDVSKGSEEVSLSIFHFSAQLVDFGEQVYPLVRFCVLLQ